MTNQILVSIEVELKNNIKGKNTFRGEDETYYYFLNGDDDIRVRKTDFACFIKRFYEESWNYLLNLNI